MNSFQGKTRPKALHRFRLHKKQKRFLYFQHCCDTLHMRM